MVYVNFPNWTGTKAKLQMVGGADTLLDHLSNNGTTVNVTLATDKIFSAPGFQTLKQIVKTPQKVVFII